MTAQKEWLVEGNAWMVGNNVNTESITPSRWLHEGPAPMREQIEADWLRQEELRNNPVASSKQPTPEEDARGGCDGGSAYHPIASHSSRCGPSRPALRSTVPLL